MSASTPPYEIEYGQVNDNIRALADIRFKLLALLPPLGSVAVFLLSQAAVTREPEQSAKPEHYDFALVLLLSLMGFLATLGLTCYDQRNSELYDALIRRARALEGRMKLTAGQFSARPTRRRHLLFFLLMWHDLGLSLIYGTVLGAWFFPAVYSALRLLGYEKEAAFWPALPAALVMVSVFVVELLRQDGAWWNLWEWMLCRMSPRRKTREGLNLLRALREIRGALKKYTAENFAPPVRLTELVEKGYLKKLPPDPLTGRVLWLTERAQTPCRPQRLDYVTRVYSASAEHSSPRLRRYTKQAGKPYNKW
jgi:hypothetical protein